MSLKNCPFCGGGDITPVLYCKTYDNAGRCEDCGATCNHWNTRAAPTMKAWVWCEGDGADEVEACLDFKAFVYRNKGERMWTAYVETKRVVVTDKLDDAQAACVAYVEGKLKEWLV